MKRKVVIDAFNLTKKIVAEVLNTKRPHLLLFSFIFGILRLTSGVKAMIYGLSKAYNDAVFVFGLDIC